MIDFLWRIAATVFVLSVVGGVLSGIASEVRSYSAETRDRCASISEGCAGASFISLVAVLVLWIWL